MRVMALVNRLIRRKQRWIRKCGEWQKEEKEGIETKLQQCCQRSRALKGATGRLTGKPWEARAMLAQNEALSQLDRSSQHRELNVRRILEDISALR